MEKVSCCCKTAFYCSNECKDIDGSNHKELCKEVTRKECIMVTDSTMVCLVNGVLSRGSFSGLMRGNRVFWGTVDFYSHDKDGKKYTMYTHEGQMSSRKKNGEIIGVFHGVGLKTRLSTCEIHMGNFSESAEHGIGISIQKRNGNTMSGKWENGKIHIASQKFPNHFGEDYSQMTIVNDVKGSTGDNTKYIQNDNAFDFCRKNDILAYKVTYGDFYDGEYVIKKQMSVKNMRCKILDVNMNTSRWNMCECILWGDISDGSDEDPDIMEILKEETCYLAQFLIEGECIYHGDKAFTPFLDEEISDHLVDFIFFSGDIILCKCVESIKTLSKSKPVEMEVSDSKIKICKRKNMPSDYDTSDTDTGSSSDSDSPGIRGLSKRDMGCDIILETSYSSKVEKMLSLNKWVIFRNKNHLVYTRDVVIKGVTSTQKLVCATTPSDRRSGRQVLKNIKNLNRGVESIIEK